MFLQAQCKMILKMNVGFSHSFKHTSLCWLSPSSIYMTKTHKCRFISTQPMYKERTHQPLERVTRLPHPTQTGRDNDRHTPIIRDKDRDGGHHNHYTQTGTPQALAAYNTLPAVLEPWERNHSLHPHPGLSLNTHLSSQLTYTAGNIIAVVVVVVIVMEVVVIVWVVMTVIFVAGIKVMIGH